MVNIAVLGTGANGSSITASLIDAGYNIVMIDQWADHVNAIREDGLLIQLPEEDIVKFVIPKWREKVKSDL